MLDPVKTAKSIKYISNIESILKGMTVRNWITGLHGIIIAVLMLSKIWAPSQYQPKINDTIGVLTATGFLAAKDFNAHSTVAETQEATFKEGERRDQG